MMSKLLTTRIITMTCLAILFVLSLSPLVITNEITSNRTHFNESDNKNSIIIDKFGTRGDEIKNSRSYNSIKEEWNKTYGGSGWEEGMSVQQTSDGGFIIGGITSSYGAGDMDAWLIKTDSSGSEQWNKTYGGGGADFGLSVQQTLDDGYIIAGYTASYGVGGAGNGDVWLVKTNSSGDEQWNKTLGGSGWDFGHVVQQTSDNGYIIVGSTGSYGAGDGDIWLIKTNASGTEQWNKTFGGTKREYGLSVQQTSDSGYIITGCTNSTSSGDSDLWLIKTNASGSEQWNKTFGGSERDEGQTVQETSDGGYIIAGATNSSDNMDVWLIKTNASGNEQWNKTFGGSKWDVSSFHYFGHAVQQTSDNGYIIAGTTESYGAGDWDVWIIKTNASGNEQWNKTFGGREEDFGHSIQHTSDGGYIITGLRNLPGVGGQEVWLIKINRTDPNRTPIANAGPDQNVAVNQTVYFNGNASYDPDGDPLNYTWAFGDNTGSGWQSSGKASHSYQSPGNYTVTLTVFDGLLINKDTCMIRVLGTGSNNTAPVANAGPDQNVTVNQTVIFDGSSSYDPNGDNLTYNWDFGDGNSTGWQSSSYTTYKYTKPGTYKVSLKVSDGSLNDTDVCYVKAIKIENSYYNKNWSVPKRITNFDYSFIPSPSSVVVDFNDEWHIVFSDRDEYKNESETRYVKYMNKTTTVTLAKEFGTQFNGTGKGVGHPSIAIDSKGNLHVVYILWSNNDWDNQSIMYTTKKANSNTWSTAQELTKFEYSFIPSPVSIAVDSNSDWHIVFPDRDRYKNQSETRYVKYMNKTTTVTLAKEFGTQFNGTGKGVGHPSITIDLKGNLHVVYILWSNDDWDNQSIMYKTKKSNSNTWSIAQELTKFDYSFIPSPVSIAVDSKGNWHIVFSDRDRYKDQSETRYAKYMNKTTTVTLASEIGNIFLSAGKGIGNPSIAIDSKENLHVIYIKWSNDDWDNQSIMYVTKKTQTVLINKTDTDQDNLPDAWEIKSFGNLIQNANEDPDNDGYTNLREYLLNTDPINNDTDHDGVIDSNDIFPLDETQWSDNDGDGYGDNQFGKNYDLFPNDPTEWIDTDQDGIGDNSDAFPNDAAASLDSDGDKYPDSWNPGMKEKDSTTGLKLDSYPNDPNRQTKKITGGNNLFIVILIICVILILVILASVKLFVLKSKRQHQEEPSGDDDILSKVKHKILYDETLTEMEYSQDEIEGLLERKLKTGQISEHTYNLIKSEILGSEEAQLDQKIKPEIAGKE